MKDLRGNVKKVILYVQLSKKRLVWRTGSQTKNGAQFFSADATTYGFVSTQYSTFSRGVLLFGNVNPEYAYVGYRFYLPNAAVYKKLTFKVLGRPFGTGNPGYMSISKTSGGEGGTRTSGYKYAWYGTTVYGGKFVNSNSAVRAWYTCAGGNTYYDIDKVRLVYRYGVLR